MVDVEEVIMEVDVTEEAMGIMGDATEVDGDMVGGGEQDGRLLILITIILTIIILDQFIIASQFTMFHINPKLLSFLEGLNIENLSF